MTITAAFENRIEQQVREAEKSFPGEVAGIRYSVGEDWNGDQAIFFRILLTDQASQSARLSKVTRRVLDEIYDLLGFADMDYRPYFNFRNQSEQDKMKDPEWP